MQKKNIDLLSLYSFFLWHTWATIVERILSSTNSSYKRRDPRTEAKENAYLNCIASEINPVRNKNDKKLLINVSETGQLHDLST